MITEQLKPDLEKAVSILKQAGANKVFLFGSIATGEGDDKSDIDIGVSGLPPELFFTVYAELSEALERPVDLVDFDKENDFFKMLKHIDEVLQIG